MAARKLVDKPFVAPADCAPEDSEKVLSVTRRLWLLSVVPTVACVLARSALFRATSLVVVTAELPFWEPASDAINAGDGPIAGVIDRGGTDA